MNCITNNSLSPQCVETILQTIAEGLLLIDQEGTIRYCNTALEEMTGKSSKELVGKKCCSVMNSQCSPPPTCTLFKDGAITNRECLILHLSGKTLPVLKNAKVLRDPQGEIIGAVETFTDISVLKSTENRLQVLEESIRRKEKYGIIGKSHRMMELFSLIELASASNATVLITGETGSGKELVARAIHNEGIRKGKSFITVNCSALPESLLESELFGHVKGAFTGAFRDKPGRFELADGGTLFLDEIGELSPLIQVKLLRFLQEREFERVGDTITRKADVRIVAATHRDLRKRVNDGYFREDLFYRLKVFPLHVPPLRERKEDIGALVDHFIDRFNSETGKHITGLSHDAAITMMDYCWPGNVRELENAIEHAFVTCQEQTIDIFDLPIEIRKVELRDGVCRNEERGIKVPDAKSFLIQHRKTTDEEFISILNECNGNQTEAAKRLGVDRTTIWRRLKRLGLS